MKYEINITEQVNKELKNNEKTYRVIYPEIQKGDVKVKDMINEEELKVFRNRYPSLGMGESSVILTALKMQKDKKRCYAVLDDKKSRDVASRLGVNLTGTYGLLKALKERKHIDDNKFNECKREMRKSKYLSFFQFI